jgi:pimeloyl-ACP methyl ester carboxylesterase
MRLFYRKYGSGLPLIILHGLFGSSDNWVSIAKGLSDRFTVLLPDLRNHGQSPHSNIHDYNSMKDDLYDLVNELKIEKVFPGAELIVVPGAGHWIHADNPEMVTKCFLKFLDIA